VCSLLDYFLITCSITVRILLISSAYCCCVIFHCDSYDCALFILSIRLFFAFDIHFECFGGAYFCICAYYVLILRLLQSSIFCYSRVVCLLVCFVYLHTCVLMNTHVLKISIRNFCLLVAV
jgi:hypothetical protein